MDGIRRALSGSPSGSDGARPSGSLRGATAEAQGYCQGPFRERRCPNVRVPSGERRFEGRCQGPPRGATAPDRQGPYGERRLKRKGTVGVPSGSDGALLSGSPSGSDGSKGTVRVPSGSGGAVLSGSLRGATVRRVLSGSLQGAAVRTVRVPPGSDGSKGTVRVPAGSDRTAAAAKGLRCPRHSNAAPPD